ncbi:MAG: hypothetical protein E7082_00220 [Bacteroidales bacterium]|nr:hypothetical protein [Bacteroidales bacterium]
MMRRFIMAFALLITIFISSAKTPKYEFRGAWIQTIFQGYDKRTTAENKAYLTNMLDNLQLCGINAVIFQVRPRADAFYKSEIEPWSAFLTGTVGKAPSPYWDPLQFMVEECHKRGMELHAWLNPYRAVLIDDLPKLPKTHLLKTHPERFVKYGKLYYFEPSLQANREHICNIVADITKRYDIDGIHFDDYFYPYPIPKTEFPDAKAYAAAKTKLSKADWRRKNIEKLIKQVSGIITEIKPWVRFGISPFGIWRNASTDPKGSQTSGLQNYDDLYADVPYWAEQGWIDYQIPQIYWELNHKNAPYGVLAKWWIKNRRGRHVYIGQDAEKTAKFNELNEKMRLAKNADGNCWWYASSLPKVSDSLKNGAYSTPALVPEYIWKQTEPASAPQNVRFTKGKLSWNKDPNARKWVIYRFRSNNEIDIDNPAAICAVTYSPIFSPKKAGIYVITALDNCNGESAPSTSIKVTL